MHNLIPIFVGCDACESAAVLGGGVVGGFVGGVLSTAALGATIFAVLLQKMKLAHTNLFDLILVSSLLMYFHTELK